MFHFTRHLASPLTGAQFLLPNVGGLFTVQCESPVLFPKCGNIIQPDQCFHPQHGATYRMSQRKREGVTHTQEKHFQSTKCQWTFTVRRLTHRATWTQELSISLSWVTFGEDLRPGVRERTKAWWSITIHRVPWLLIRPACYCLLKTTYLLYLKLPAANHSSLCDSSLLACHP